MRRSRWTVTFEDGTKVVIGAYDQGDVLRHYTKQGRNVRSIRKGDYRIEARREAIKAAGGFRIDRAALEAAKAELGIKMPVSISFNGRVGRQNGNHRFPMERSHKIMLKSYLTADQASSTLWHELTHAMQAERAIAAGRSWGEVHAEQWKYTYRARPIEREACRMSERMAHRKLCKSA